MPSSTYALDGNPILQSRVIDVDILLGYRLTETYIGTFDALQNELNKLDLNKKDNNFVRGRIETNPEALPRLIAEYAVVLPTTWLVERNALQKNIFDHPKFQALAGGDPYSITVLSTGLQDAFKNNYSVSEEIANNTKFGVVYNALSAGDKVTFGLFYADYDRGVRYFNVSQPVVIKNIVFNEWEEGSFNYHEEWASSMFTYAGLEATFGPIPLSVSTNIPTNGYYLYYSGRVEQQTNGFFIVQQTFYWATDYSTNLYTLIL